MVNASLGSVLRGVWASLHRVLSIPESLGGDYGCERPSLEIYVHFGENRGLPHKQSWVMGFENVFCQLLAGGYAQDDGVIVTATASTALFRPHEWGWATSIFDAVCLYPRIPCGETVTGILYATFQSLQHVSGTVTLTFDVSSVAPPVPCAGTVTLTVTCDASSVGPLVLCVATLTVTFDASSVDPLVLCAATVNGTSYATSQSLRQVEESENQNEISGAISLCPR